MNPTQPTTNEQILSTFWLILYIKCCFSLFYIYLMIGTILINWKTKFSLEYFVWTEKLWFWLKVQILLLQHFTNGFKSLPTFQSRKKQIKLLGWCVFEMRDKNEKDTGRCWGCFFQHICINSTSFWGQFEGISGVNPLSLYSKMKDQNEKFIKKWKKEN
jgi:hypothetical protein